MPRLSLDLGKKSQLSTPDYDRALFAKLKYLRKTIAEQDDVPPFVVFSDATLADMADKFPESQFEFLDIHGVGQTKLERYGEGFIAGDVGILSRREYLDVSRAAKYCRALVGISR